MRLTFEHIHLKKTKIKKHLIKIKLNISQLNIGINFFVLIHY